MTSTGMRPLRDKPDLRGYPLARVADELARMGEKPYRARQLFRWLHQKGAATFDEMTDLPRDLRARLAERFELWTLEAAEERRSTDGTIKWKRRTVDGRFIESVFMPHAAGAAAGPAGDEEDDDDAPRGRERRTLCVSSQIGCAIGCTFCMTATMGLARNLGPGEIVDQVHRANRRLVELGVAEGPRPITNLVFMGMGEPLANYRSLKVALELLLSEDGPNFSQRRVTVSTSGLVPVMRRLGEETQVKLAVSLNATTDAQRDALMPINKRYPIAQLLEACRTFPVRNGRRITVRARARLFEVRTGGCSRSHAPDTAVRSICSRSGHSTSGCYMVSATDPLTCRRGVGRNIGEKVFQGSQAVNDKRPPVSVTREA